MHWMCVLSVVWLAAAAQAHTQPVNLRARIDAYVERQQASIVRELARLLSVPNVAADRENIRRNAVLLREMLTKRGFAAEILEMAGNPLVYGELRTPGAARTLLLYAHFDGQPVDSAGWKQSSPFTPALRDGRLDEGARDLGSLETRSRFEPDWRIYARSASDDKAPIVALCAAVDALKASGLAPTSNLRLVLDGEEEAGSPSLVPAIAKYRERFAADAMIILDGPTHPSGRPTLVFGARGIVPIQLTVYGPKVPLHSGHYGNWVPNPAMRLARLLASMKQDGKVLVDGFYDGIEPLAPEERRLLASVPDDPDELMRLYGFAEPEARGRSLQEGLQLPTLNVRGLASGYVGDEARTVIPPSATAEIDIRLVAETPPDAMVEHVRAHLRKQGYHVVSDEPDDATRLKHPRLVRMLVGSGTAAYRTSPLLPVSKEIAAALERAFGEPPVRIRTSGGTVPIAPFIDAMGFPAISVPIVNFDNNQHGENENLRLGHFFRGITTIAAVLTM